MMAVYQPTYRNSLTGLVKKSRYWWYSFTFSGFRVQRCSGELTRYKARAAEGRMRKSLELAYNGLETVRTVPYQSSTPPPEFFNGYKEPETQGSPNGTRETAVGRCSCLEQRGALQECQRSEVISFYARGFKYSFSAPACCFGFWCLPAREWVTKLYFACGINLFSEREFEGLLERHYGRGGFSRNRWPAPAYKGDNYNSIYFDVRALATSGKFPRRPGCLICDLPFREWEISGDDCGPFQICSTECRLRLLDLLDLDRLARRDHRVREVLLNKVARRRISKERECLKIARDRLTEVRRLLRTNFSENRAASN